MTATSAQRPGDSTLPNAKQCFRGIPASRGRAVGRAFVFKTAQAAADVEAGAILVVRTLPAGLGPAFARLAGVVVERGGPLSNGLTIAREAGLPAVVLQDATTLLRTGDLITIDGTRGTVEVDRSDAAGVSPQHPGLAQ